MKKVKWIVLGIIVFAIVAILSSAQTPTYTLPVSATVLFSDGIPFQGQAILYDTTSNITVKTWTLSSTGTVSDTLSLDPTHGYRIDLIGGSGKVRESEMLFPAFFPSLTSASFTITLTHNFQPDGQTYIGDELDARFKL
jgi:hypothetical protein